MNDICKTMVSPTFGAIRIAGTKEKPLFCLSDVCRALDIKKKKKKIHVIVKQGFTKTVSF